MKSLFLRVVEFLSICLLLFGLFAVVVSFMFVLDCFEDDSGNVKIKIGIYKEKEE